MNDGSNSKSNESGCPATRRERLRDSWLLALSAELAHARALRRALHRDPRLSGDESATTALVGYAMEIELAPSAQTGGAARIGPPSGPAIGLRSELDALPVSEATGVEWAASNGAMHACGHDIHLAALSAVVRAARSVDLPHGLVAVLQPREEAYPSGAKDMVTEGVIERFEIAHMIGAHVHPGVERGKVAAGSGFVNAAAGELEILVTGRGGHGAYPHRAADVASAIAHIVTGIPEMLRRTVDPLVPALVSVGTIAVGTGTSNVLPSEGRVVATVRTTSDRDTRHVVDALGTFVRHQAVAFGCVGVLSYTEGEPALCNDGDLSRELRSLLVDVGLEPADPVRSLGADDFSFFGDVVPSAMCFVGVETPGVSLHDAEFLPDDDAIECVARTFIAGYLAAARLLDVSAP